MRYHDTLCPGLQHILEMFETVLHFAMDYLNLNSILSSLGVPDFVLMAGLNYIYS